MTTLTLPVTTAMAVELSSVTKFHGRRRHRVAALHDLSASFPQATFTGVMGLSGSGKTTLLQCAAGLDRPTSGSVRLAGTEITGLNRRRLAILRRQRVGFVFQAFNLVPVLSVEGNIALPLRLDGRRIRRQAVLDMAERVGIANLLGRRPDSLSGGQQQRVAIARALITEPDVIFADEPTAALDPCSSEDVLGLLRRAVDDLGRTVVMVTHDPIAAAFCDRALLLHHGRLAEVVESPDPSLVASVLRHFRGADR